MSVLPVASVLLLGKCVSLHLISIRMPLIGNAILFLYMCLSFCETRWEAFLASHRVF